MVRALLAIPIFRNCRRFQTRFERLCVFFLFLSLVDVPSFVARLYLLRNRCEPILPIHFIVIVRFEDLFQHQIEQYRWMELNQTSKPRNETIRIKFNNIFLENILKKNSREIRATLSVVDTLFKIRGVPRFGVTRKNSGGLGRDRDTSSDLARIYPTRFHFRDLSRCCPKSSDPPRNSNDQPRTIFYHPG